MERPAAHGYRSMGGGEGVVNHDGEGWGALIILNFEKLVNIVANY